MTPDRLRSWRRDLGMTQDGAAEALGVSKSSVANWEAGRRREDGRPAPIPRTVALACAAISAGLEPL